MNGFLGALSDARSQTTNTLTLVARAFGEDWRMGFAPVADRPIAAFYLAAVFAIVVLVLGRLAGGRRLAYRRGRFLTPNEKSFLRALDAALGRNYRAFAQVRLAELADPADGTNINLRRKALHGVMAKSVDFVICDVLTPIRSP